MTLRELHGWSPRTVTVDGDGNVLSVTVKESRFTRREVARLLASRRAQNAPRGDHGILLAEAIDPANRDSFSVDEPVMDFAAKAVHDAREKYKQRWPDAVIELLRWRVRKN